MSNYAYYRVTIIGSPPDICFFTSSHTAWHNVVSRKAHSVIPTRTDHDTSLSIDLYGLHTSVNIPTARYTDDEHTAHVVPLLLSPDAYDAIQAVHSGTNALFLDISFNHYRFDSDIYLLSQLYTKLDFHTRIVYDSEERFEYIHYRSGIKHEHIIQELTDSSSGSDTWTITHQHDSDIMDSVYHISIDTDFHNNIYRGPSAPSEYNDICRN